MPYIDCSIIIYPDKVQRRPPCVRRNPEKLLTIYVPPAHRLVLEGHVDPAVDNSIEEMLVVKIVQLPRRCCVIAADRQHALRGDFAKCDVMRQTDLRLWLQPFDGVIGTDVCLEQMQVCTVGPVTLEREARRPYATEIPKTEE